MTEIKHPILYLITRGNATVSNFADAIRQITESLRTAVSESVDLVQIREKQLPAKLIYELAVSAAEITRGTSTRLLINDRPDIALAAGADGVQLPSNSMPTGVIRQNLPRPFLIGVSTHTVEEAGEAAREGADFALFGPVFETPGKDDVQGIDNLSRVCLQVAPFPIIAIGGIDTANCRKAVESGASGIAAIRSLASGEGIRDIRRELNK